MSCLARDCEKEERFYFLACEEVQNWEAQGIYTEEVSFAEQSTADTVKISLLQLESSAIDKIKNKAGYNLIDANNQQVAFQYVPTTLLFGI